MKRPGYRFGVEWIALNDDPDVTDEEMILGTLTVGMLADLFGVTQERVAADVVRYRHKERNEQCQTT